MSKGFEIDVAKYCEDCESFIPEVHSQTYGNNTDGYKTWHHIYCRHKQTCANICRHIERKLKEGQQ